MIREQVIHKRFPALTDCPLIPFETLPRSKSKTCRFAGRRHKTTTLEPIRELKSDTRLKTRTLILFTLNSRTHIETQNLYQKFDFAQKCQFITFLFSNYYIIKNINFTSAIPHTDLGVTLESIRELVKQHAHNHNNIANKNTHEIRSPRKQF